MDFENLKFKDVALFLDLVKTKSIRELARQRGVNPGQISKSIRTLESALKESLIDRSTSGIGITAYAAEVIPIFENILEGQEKIKSLSSVNQKSGLITIATTSFFAAHFVPMLLGKLDRFDPNLHGRVLDLAPTQFVSVGLRNGFDVSFNVSKLEWPGTWETVSVGQIRWRLYSRAGHPLLKSPTKKETLTYPFVSPIYWTPEGVRSGNDNFPIPIGERIKGFEVTTASAAAHVVANTNQLGFLPNIVARAHVDAGKISPVQVSAFRDIPQKVYLSVKADVVSQKLFEWLKKTSEDFFKNQR
jgi:DNA-binding transcriptional LysR family regulator